MKEEDSNQAALIKWADMFDNIGPFLHAIANGGSRHILEAVKLKKTGVRAGVFDLFLMIPKEVYHGLFIEMKSKKGKLTEKQKEFQKRAESKNYCTFVAYSWLEAKDKILDYLEK